MWRCLVDDIKSITIALHPEFSIRDDETVCLSVGWSILGKSSIDLHVDFGGLESFTLLANIKDVEWMKSFPLGLANVAATQL